MIVIMIVHFWNLTPLKMISNFRMLILEIHERERQKPPLSECYIFGLNPDMGIEDKEGKDQRALKGR